MKRPVQTGLELAPPPVASMTRLAGLSGSRLTDRLLAQHQRVVGAKGHGAPSGNLDAVFARIEPRPAGIHARGWIRQILAEVRPVRIYQPAVLSRSASGGERQAWYEVDIDSANLVSGE